MTIGLIAHDAKKKLMQNSASHTGEYSARTHCMQQVPQAA